MLGLIDGQKILQALKGSNAAWNALILNDLPSMLAKMQFTNVPIHFVISKWDLLSNEFDLEQVRELLFEFDHFRNLVETRNSLGSIVRLIPVSAVGNDFAIPQPNGEMQKKGKAPKPFQVEMPLACVVPDIMEVIRNELLKKKQEEEERVVEIKPNLNFLDRIKMVTADSLRMTKLLLPVNLKFTDDMIESLSNYTESGVTTKIDNAAQRSEELRQDRDAALQLIESEEHALNHTMQCFRNIRRVLEYTFPKSKLELELEE